MSDIKHRPIKPYADGNDWVTVQSDSAGLGEEKRVKVSDFVNYINREPYKTAGVGDSIFLRNGPGNSLVQTPTGTQSPNNTVTGQFTLLNSLLGHPFNMVANAGVAGSRSGDIKGQLQGVINSGVAIEYLVIATGTNDLNFSPYTAQLTTSYVAEAIALAKTIPTLQGIMLFTPPPHGAMSAPSIAQHNETVALMLATFSADPMIDIIQWNKYTEDFNGAVGAWRTGYATDGVHPDTYVAMYLAIAYRLATLKEKYAHAASYGLLYQGLWDSWQGAGSPSSKPYGDGFNILADTHSKCTGSGTSTPGTATIVGTPPAGWTLVTSGAGLTVTCSQEPCDDVDANWFVMTIDIASGSGQSAYVQYQSDSRIQNGKFYELVNQVEIVSGQSLISRLYAEIGAATGTLSTSRDLDYSNIVANSPQPAAASYLLKTPRLLSKSGDAMRMRPLNLSFTGTVGTAKIRMRLPTVREYSNAIDW